MPFSSFRSLFPFAGNKVYLNHAAVSPLSTDVREKMEWFINERSFGDIEFIDETIKIKEETRSLLAQLIHAEKDHIGFVTNTSEGLNILAQGLEWKEGDEIIIPECEFPANIYPFLNLERKGVKIKYIPSPHGIVEIEEIEKAISSKTRLLTISFVEYANGFRNDLEQIGKICTDKGIIFCVDAIQGVGAMSLDVQACNIDFLSCGGHKWLMGPMGAGFIYLNSRMLKEIQPAYTGWLAVEDAWDFSNIDLKLLPNARRFEYATQNFAGIAGLSASVELLVRLGPAAIEQHLLILGQEMVDDLSELGMEFMGHKDSVNWSGIYSFKAPDAELLFEFLHSREIYCSLRKGAIRIAPHFYNNRDDINLLVRAIGEWHKK